MLDSDYQRPDPGVLAVLRCIRVRCSRHRRGERRGEGAWQEEGGEGGGAGGGGGYAQQDFFINEASTPGSLPPPLSGRLLGRSSSGHLLKCTPDPELRSCLVPLQDCAPYDWFFCWCLMMLHARCLSMTDSFCCLCIPRPSPLSPHLTPHLQQTRGAVSAAELAALLDIPPFTVSLPLAADAAAPTSAYPPADAHSLPAVSTSSPSCTSKSPVPAAEATTGRPLTAIAGTGGDTPGGKPFSSATGTALPLTTTTTTTSSAGLHYPGGTSPPPPNARKRRSGVGDGGSGGGDRGEGSLAWCAFAPHPASAAVAAATAGATPIHLTSPAGARELGEGPRLAAAHSSALTAVLRGSKCAVDRGE